MAGAEEKFTYVDQNAYIHFHGYDLWDELMHIEREMYGDVIKIPRDIPIEPGFKTIHLADTFSDGDVIQTGKYEVMTVHLPGHCAGIMVSIWKSKTSSYSDDIDLVKTGPWYNSNSGSVGDLIASVQIIKICPRVWSSLHTAVSRRRIWFLSWMLTSRCVLDREEKIYNYLHQPHTIDQLATYRLTYPQQRDQYEAFWEKMTIRNHLRHMLELGLIKEIEPGVYQQI
jgi:hypothetical protein